MYNNCIEGGYSCKNRSYFAREMSAFMGEFCTCVRSDSSSKVMLFYLLYIQRVVCSMSDKQLLLKLSTRRRRVETSSQGKPGLENRALPKNVEACKSSIHRSTARVKRFHARRDRYACYRSGRVAKKPVIESGFPTVFGSAQALSRLLTTSQTYAGPLPTLRPTQQQF